MGKKRKRKLTGTPKPAGWYQDGATGNALTQGNPIMPADGAGPRSAVPVTVRQTEAMVAALRAGKHVRALTAEAIQTRAFPLGGIELRQQSPTTAHFVGYASTTNEPYPVTDFLGEYRETIMPGAFAKTLRESANVPLLFNHGGMPVASTAGGTMRLSEDAKGLRVEADLDRRQSIANDLCIALERGDLTQMSFSFSAVKQGWSDDYTERSVTELRLYDASIVTYPANPTTTAALRGPAKPHVVQRAAMGGHVPSGVATPPSARHVPARRRRGQRRADGERARRVERFALDSQFGPYFDQRRASSVEVPADGSKVVYHFPTGKSRTWWS